ncbi:MAG: iron ABC transporter permease [Deltaproteobacteria bacterium]
MSIGVGATAALLLFAVWPLAAVLRTALADGGAPLLAELAEPGAHEAWFNTLVLAGWVTGLAVPLGATLAWVVERTDAFVSERTRGATGALLTLPLAVPPYLLAMAWALLGNGRNGLLNRIASAPWVDLYGLDGIVLVLVTASYPFVLLAVRASLSRADPALEEAARTAGAGPVRVLIDVTIPLVLPSMAAAAGLVFVFATAAFGVPYLLGSVASPPVYFLTTRIFRYTTLGGEDMLARAAALAIVLLATSGLAQAASSWLAKRRSTVQVSGKSSRPSLVRLGPLRFFVRAGLALFALTAIVLPLSTIAWTSLAKSFAEPGTLSFVHWNNVLAREETLGAFVHSIVLALLTGALVAVLGLVVARMAKVTRRAGAVVSFLASAPYAVPGTVLAIGLLLAFSLEYRVIVADRVTFALYLPGTLGLLIVAYGVKYLAFGVRGARAALDQIHPSLEEAARTSGAGPLRGTVDVLLPLVSPAVLAAFVVVALPCLSELTMSVLLFGAHTQTAGTLLFELQSYADPPAASVVATLVVGIALVGDFLSRRLSRRRTT